MTNKFKKDIKGKIYNLIKIYFIIFSHSICFEMHNLCEKYKLILDSEIFLTIMEIIILKLIFM